MNDASGWNPRLWHLLQFGKHGCPGIVDMDVLMERPMLGLSIGHYIDALEACDFWDTIHDGVGAENWDMFLDSLFLDAI